MKKTAIRAFSALAVGACMAFAAPTAALAVAPDCAPGNAVAATCDTSADSAENTLLASLTGSRLIDTARAEPLMGPVDTTTGRPGMLLELWVAGGVAAFAAGGAAVAISVRRNRRLIADMTRA